MSNTAPETPRPKRRRRLLFWCTRAMVGVFAGVALALGLLMFMMTDSVLRLPDWARARIEARLDTVMAANQISLGSIGVGLASHGWVPQLVFGDIEMTSDGRTRASFPEVAVSLDSAAFFAGEMRPSLVEVSGAGLRLRRDADGSLDLTLTNSDLARERDLAETMAMIDQMFSMPAFSALREVSGTGLVLDLEDAVTGETLRVRDAALILTRTEGAVRVSVGGAIDGRENSSLSLSFSRRTAEARTSLRVQFRNFTTTDLATSSPALAWLSLLQAPISGAMSTDLGDDGSIGDLAGMLDVGQGLLVPGGGSRPRPFESLRAYFDYDAATARLNFSELDVRARALTARAVGHADLQDGPSYLAQFRLTDIVSDPQGMFQAPLHFAGGAVDLRLQLSPLVVELGQAVLYDDDLHVSLDGRIAVEDDGVRMRMNARIPRIDAADVVPLWPLTQVRQTRQWLSEHLLEGEITDLSAGLRLQPGAPGQSAVTFDFDAARVIALHGMPPIQNGRGYLALTGPSMTLALHEGQVEAPNGEMLDVAGSVMRIPEIRPTDAQTQFDLRVQGDLPTVLTFLRAPPLNLMSTMERDIATLATGTAMLNVGLELPIRPGLTMNDLRFDVTGTLSDVESRTLVPDRLLRADQLEVRVVPDRIEISGRASLDGLPLTGTWSRALGPDASADSLVEGTATLSSAVLEDLGVPLPPGMMTGQGPAEFRLDLPADDLPRLSVASELNGIGFTLDPLGWRHGAGATGRMRAEVVLGPTPTVPLLEVEASGLTLQGQVSLRPEGGLDRVTLERFAIDDWLDVTGELLGRGAGQQVGIEVNGGSLDLRNAPAAADRQGGNFSALGGPLVVRLDRLDVSNGIALTGFSADLDTSGGVSGQFQGEVNGAVPVRGTLVTTANGPAVWVRSSNGGAVLRAAGVFATAYGGDLELILQPTTETGSYDGRLTIDGPRLRNAPVMAELLNAVSVVGILEQLGGDGINMGQVEAQFRLTPRAVTVTQGSALGPSLGISMDGVYDIVEGRYEMQGVISPFYLVNGIFGAIFAPRREGLFGFSYRLSGTADNSSVSVNPLSILTPGIFREIFRAPAPQVSQ